MERAFITKWIKFKLKYQEKKRNCPQFRKREKKKVKMRMRKNDVMINYGKWTLFI